MLWWLAAILVFVAIVSVSLSDWHWDAAIREAWFRLVSPEVSGFPAPHPDCEIAQNGISPNGQIAYIISESTEPGVSAPPDCLVFHSQPRGHFDLPINIGSSSAKRGGYDGVIRWAKDSLAVIVFKDNPTFGGGAYEIYVIPFVEGKPGKITNLETEIYKIPHDDFVKDHAKEMNDMAHIAYEIQDGHQPDDLTFNESNQIIVDCVCTNNPNDNPNDLVLVKGWSAHVTALWDPIQAKFIRSDHQVIPISR